MTFGFDAFSSARVCSVGRVRDCVGRLVRVQGRRAHGERPRVQRPSFENEPERCIADSVA